MKTTLILLTTLIFLCISTNFAQWQPVNSPQISINDMLILTNGDMLLAANDGVYRSTDNGNSWNMFPISYQVKLIKKDYEGKIYCAAGRLYRSDDNGFSWTLNYSGIPSLIQDFYINEFNHIYVISGLNSDPSAYKSTDSSQNWENIYYHSYVSPNYSKSFGITETVSGSIFITFHYRTTGFQKPYLRRKDVNTNWQTIEYNMVFLNIYFLDSVMYLPTTAHYWYGGYGIFKSYDYGNTLIAINEGLNSLNILQLVITPEVFIAVTGDGIYRSLDQGNYWMRLDHTGLNANVKRIYYDDSGTLYACTENGVFQFTGELPVELVSFTGTINDNTVLLRWITASELNNLGFEIQRKTTHSDWITIGFKSGGGTLTTPSEYYFSDDVSLINFRQVNYRLKQIDFNGIFSYSNEVNVNLIPGQFIMLQNYPNPFNPKTIIRYQLPKESKVLLKVFDILGKEVEVLIDEVQDAGYKQIEYNGTSLASGLYIYKLITEEYVASRKMMILK